MKIKENEVEVVNEKEMTPSEYFEYVKGMKKTVTAENQQKLIDNCLLLLEKPRITGQKKMAEQIIHAYELAKKQMDALNAGFDIYVSKEDVIKYIKEISKQTVKLIELENYTREVPDEVMDKLIKAKGIFDLFFIAFTDYTGEMEKQVAKERRDKDPILFGAFIEKDNIPEDRLYFIADWIDEYCDLTLKQMVNEYEAKTDRGMIYEVDIPTDVEELKKFFGLTKKESDMAIEPKKGFFRKVKETVEKKTTKRRSRKVTNNDEV